MSLRVVFEAITGGLKALRNDLGLPVPSCELGEEHLPMTGEMPSIVWVPVGAHKIDWIAGPKAPMSAREPRGLSDGNQLASREEVVTIWVRAADYDQTELLLNHLVESLRVQMTAFSVKLLGSTWGIAQPANTKEPKSAPPKSGTECGLSVQVNLPFIESKKPVAPAGTLTPVLTGEIIH